MAMWASSATSMPRVATRVRARIGGAGSTGRVVLRPRRRAVPRAAPVTTSTTPPPFVDFDTTGCGPFPLLDPTRGYTHVSPGVCDTCADSAEARRAWVELLLGQLPSHRANAERTAKFLGDECPPDYTERYRAWEGDYEEYLAEVSKDGVPKGAGATLLDMVDEKERLLRRRGLDDMFAGLKAAENAIASVLFHSVASEIDGIWSPARTIDGDTHDRKGDRKGDDATAKAAMIRAVIECCLAGNLFDAGAAAAVQGVQVGDFCEPCVVEPDSREMSEEEAGRYRLDADQLAEVFARARRRVSREECPGGWRFDSFSDVVSRCRDLNAENRAAGWRRVVVFCDNAGADVMGMVVLARALAAVGGEDTKVALVANTHAALNDVTHAELLGFLSTVSSSGGDGDAGDPILAAQMERGRVVAVPSGQFSTLLDLNRAGAELNAWVEEELRSVPAGEDWLVVFDGMGRGLESNWNPAPYLKDGVNALNLAMVKSEINAKRLGAEVYDCVVKLSVGGSK